jgi:cellobiose dehydrogenase (acceptor)
MATPASNVFSRIPGTDHPSRDGKLYVQSGYNIIGQGLKNARWTNVTANSVPGQKNRTFSFTAYQEINGERGGPMATYLVSAASRPNFQMWLNTSVERIVRTGGHATGLDVVANHGGGFAGRVNLTPITGRVIVSAGTFGTSKLLFRSGIGPTDQLQIVQSSTDAPLMISPTYWINLPVGYNLDDHLNTDTVINHPSISYYDWVAAWNTPIAADANDYLTKRVGPLTQAAPDIGPMMWEEITGPDGIVRQMQWTSRVEGSNGATDGTTMTLSLYLGRGKISRGRTVIQKGLNMVVDTLPWGNVNDLAAVATAIDHMASAMLTVPGLTYLYGPHATGEDPNCPANLTSTQFVASVSFSHQLHRNKRANDLDTAHSRKCWRSSCQPLARNSKNGHRQRSLRRRNCRCRHEYQGLWHGQYLRC